MESLLFPPQPVMFMFIGGRTRSTSSPQVMDTYRLSHENKRQNTGKSADPSNKIFYISIILYDLIRFVNIKSDEMVY